MALLRSLDDNQVDAYTAEIIGVVTDFSDGVHPRPDRAHGVYVQPIYFN